jgi:small subunit ribosomal protein S16
MIVIRLSRGGTNKRPFYHVVVSDRRKARDGRYLERLGIFNPIATGGEIRLQLDKERISQWIAKGAQPSDRVKHLLIESEKPAILEKRKVKTQARKIRKKAKATQEVQVAAATTEAPAAGAAQG